MCLPWCSELFLWGSCSLLGLSLLLPGLSHTFLRCVAKWQTIHMQEPSNFPCASAYKRYRKPTTRKLTKLQRKVLQTIQLPWNLLICSFMQNRMDCFPSVMFFFLCYVPLLVYLSLCVDHNSASWRPTGSWSAGNVSHVLEPSRTSKSFGRPELKE